MEERAGPKVWLHPPTFMMALIVTGFLLRLPYGGFMPIPKAVSEGIGVAATLAGFALMTASVRFFLENGETLLPKTPSTALLQEGPFARSRNPIYLGMVAIGCGLGFATSNVFMVALAYVGGVILNYFVIAPEEAYLEKQFGAEYTDYKARVRRWI